MVCLYKQYLSRYFTSVTSIKNYLNGIRVLHLYAGLEFTVLQSFECKMLLRGISRLKQHRVRRAAPITPQILLDLYHLMDLNEPLILACWVAYVLAFFLMSRKANLVPSSIRSFDPCKHLTRGNLVVVDNGLLVTITWSKTNQFGERILQVPLPRIRGSPLCPVRAYEQLVRLVPAESYCPAFTYACKPKLRTVTQYMFVKILRLHLEKASTMPVPSLVIHLDVVVQHSPLLQEYQVN